MRKLRKAAVAAAVVGSACMLGAGVATAGGNGSEVSDLCVTCTQANGDTLTEGDAGLPVAIGNTNTSASATGEDAAGLLGGGLGGNN